MSLSKEAQLRIGAFNSRRYFLRSCFGGIGAMALGGLLHGQASPSATLGTERSSILDEVPRAKRVIFLHMAGAPSQLELFDYKPVLQRYDGQACPPSLMEGKRFAFLSGVPKMMGPQAEFKQVGESGTWLSHHLPYLSQRVDDICFLKAMHTDEFNHAPAQLFMHTGSPRLGRPSMGSWMVYGLGSENENLPGFVVLTSGSDPSAGKSVWGSGFLPSLHQGVQCRAQGDPILFLNNPKSIDAAMRKRSIEAINEVNRREYEMVGDPEILSRISQYELAFRMQAEVPEVMDITQEPDYIHALYGTSPGRISFANNCLLARRLAEQGVRFIQLYDNAWDHHGAGKGNGVVDGLANACRNIDRPIAALLEDLKLRGLWEDTLIVWGGEFGRTPMMETRASGADFRGRDHHSEAFTVWLAGGAIKGGLSYGETDDLGYYGVKDRVHVHDLQATILHCMGVDHEQLTYHFQGRDFRLTDVHGHVVKDILS
ncbi:MAG: DUF1501 domain-containing protein [Saprospiraceae bacterium]|nr:DUF1501 domain-containing protein [Saprospiraceae bacterium]